MRRSSTTVLALMTIILAGIACDNTDVRDHTAGDAGVDGGGNADGPPVDEASCEPNPCTDVNKTTCAVANDAVVCLCNEGLHDDRSGGCKLDEISFVGQRADGVYNVEFGDPAQSTVEIANTGGQHIEIRGTSADWEFELWLDLAASAAPPITATLDSYPSKISRVTITPKLGTWTTYSYQATPSSGEFTVQIEGLTVDTLYGSFSGHLYATNTTFNPEILVSDGVLDVGLQ